MHERGSGLLLHITSLPSSYGIGDMGPDAYEFADILFATGQKYWQVLPLNPTNPENGNSPYFSSSAFAGNPILISIKKLIDEGLLSETDRGPVPDFPSGKVDYRLVHDYKGKLLKKAYHTFIKNGDALEEYQAFCREASWWLDDYALFEALTEETGKSWDEWPEPLRERHPEAIEKKRGEFAERIDREKFFQYKFFSQWNELKKYCNEKGIRIIGDIPIYVSYHSADVWTSPDIFKLDDNKKPAAVSGVPPDYFSETGQLWNNPVYRWEALRGTGFDWWVKRMAHTFAGFDIVRIDHFRGLVQYWEVPAGSETAVTGSWQDVPTYELFDTLRARLGDLPVIVEDLGLITDDVKEAIAHYGFPGMKVFVFAFGCDDPDHPYLPHNYGRNCVVYTGTHDNNTLLGWIEKEASPEEKARLYRYIYRKEPAGDINWEVIRLLMMSVAGTVVIPVQDVLGLDENARMNQPKEVEHNWRWRLGAGELRSEHMERLREVTQVYGRGLLQKEGSFNGGKQ